MLKEREAIEIVEGIVKENNRSRKIEQYDLNWNFIRTWDTIKQAADELKTNTANIIACCQGKYKKSHGFIWRYKE